MSPRRQGGAAEEDSLFSTAADAQPLAARMRPRTLDEYVGQTHLLAPGKPLRDAVEKGTPGSIIFWGPPGAGKTTLAHLIAASTGRVFVPFSAVTEGVPRIREIVNDARARCFGAGAHAPRRDAPDRRTRRATAAASARRAAAHRPRC